MVSKIWVRTQPRDRTKGILRAGGLTIPCVLGRSGITTFKREGDGATPVGNYRLLYGYYRADRTNRPLGSIEFFSTKPNIGWCDEAKHPNYNQEVSLPFDKSHEQLCRDDRLYDICIVLDYNIFPRQRNVGSAIFFHLTSPERHPTEGCVALDPKDMQKLLRILSNGVEMIISR